MTEENLRLAMAEAVDKVHEINPMAPSITNFVTIDFVANAQLAVGGSAAMVYLPDEGELLAGGQAMYLNMGTLMPVYEETIPRTAQALHAHKTPWVLDPVGLGIGSLRSKLLLDCKECKPTIIRCNASEAIALAEHWGLIEHQESGVRGVDSTDSVESAEAAACALAKFTGGAVAISGERDLVTDGKHVAYVQGGSELMTLVTGSGCALGGVAAVYAAVADPFVAAMCATAVFDLAGIRGAMNAQGPASFKVQFIDALYNASANDIANVPFSVKEI